MLSRRALIAALAAMGISLFAATAVQAYDGEYFEVCRLDPYGDNYLSLRTCPSTRCREIFRMGPGTQVVSINPDPVRGWWEIEILTGPGEGMRGWAFGRYLCRY
ncbi:SH3 domain-containing protein [Thermopetrobacter sp. TC1]|uniref:SH3 domain-containing protein n=1 Tax=Thermopetrobacter sp. TC1 TaxID=1495045 RepID=UPI00056F8655|nr:SH3 domain-containing protein [Thermopetrobacter sp. TC1]